MIAQIVEGLHAYEREFLQLVKKGGTELAQKQMDPVQFSRALQWLSNKDILCVTYKKFTVITLDKNGNTYKNDKLPEIRFLEAIKDNKNYSFEQICQKAKISQQELGAALGLLRQKQAIMVQPNKTVQITKVGEILLTQPFDEQSALEWDYPLIEEELAFEKKEVIEKLFSRKNILKKEKKQTPVVTLTKLGEELLTKDIGSTSSINTITIDVLKNKSWKEQPLRPFDVQSRVPKKAFGRIHPLTAVVRIIEDIFTQMGFSQMRGPWVETAFWCMDSMWIPQDHPARDVQDTYYLNKKGDLPDKKLLDKVKKAHEKGADGGYRGYNTLWDPQKAAELILRTHTTATTYRYFGQKNITSPSKYFYVGKVFRNETIDATHLPEFYQVEGFVVAPGLTLKDLLGLIKEFYAKLGFDKIKFKPTYNPYTEPSIEALYFDEERGEWMELINSGIFRPESLEPYGIKDPVIAWGMGLERLAMLIYKKNKLKDIIGPQCDLEWLRNYVVPRRVDKW